MNQTIKLIEAENKKGDNSEFNVSEEGINSFGYQLLKSKKIDEAFLVFTLNTKIYPDGFNAFDSLGECLFQLDKKSDGIKAYKQSLALNPKNENARKIINENE